MGAALETQLYASSHEPDQVTSAAEHSLDRISRPAVSKDERTELGGGLHAASTDGIGLIAVG